jgi:hypothetical protein
MTKPRTKAKSPANKGQSQAEMNHIPGTPPQAAVEAGSASKPAPRRRSTAATPGKRPVPVRQATGATVTDEEIRVRAYQLYLQRGGRPEDPAGDWLRAERELTAEQGSVGRKAPSRGQRAQGLDASE